MSSNDDGNELKMEGRPRAGSLEQFNELSHDVVVPWVTKLVTGHELLTNRTYNKGQAFTQDERKQLRLEGLLPPEIFTLTKQVKRCKENLKSCSTDLDKYTFLMNVSQSNEKLFYALILDDPNAMLPLVYTPTVGLACQKFAWLSSIRSGLYITLNDLGRVASIIENWPSSDVRAIVFTDGERILGLGDLGVNGMGIPIGKMALYTALGGVHPSLCMPVTIDVGTDNETLLADPFYAGLRRRRERGPMYDALIEEFILACRVRFGHNTLLQFEDFANRNAFRLLKKWKDACCCFNDDIQGTAGVSLACVLSYCRATNRKIESLKYLFFGAGSAGIGIADLLSYAISIESGCTIEEARKNVFLVDSRGLITKNRPTGGYAGTEKERYAHDIEYVQGGLEEVAKQLGASVLIGVSAIAKSFTEGVIRQMAANIDKPLICALSNPTSKAECTAEEAYTYTDGNCFFCSGSPFEPVEIKGKTYETGQANNSYIFPGVAMGVIATCCRRVPEKFFYIAAKALANTVHDSDIAKGNLFPNLNRIRKVSLDVATAIAKEAYVCDSATLYPKPNDLRKFVYDSMYSTEYRPYVHDHVFSLNPY